MGCAKLRARSIDRVIAHEAPGSRVGQFCPILERPNHQECMYLVQAHEGLFVHIKAVL